MHAWSAMAKYKLQNHLPSKQQLWTFPFDADLPPPFIARPDWMLKDQVYSNEWDELQCWGYKNVFIKEDSLEALKVLTNAILFAKGRRKIRTDGLAYYCESSVPTRMSLIKHSNCVACIQQIIQQEDQQNIQFTKRDSPAPINLSLGITEVTSEIHKSVTDENNNVEEDDSMLELADDDEVNCRRMNDWVLSDHARVEDLLQYPPWIPSLPTHQPSPPNSHPIPNLLPPMTVQIEMQPSPDVGTSAGRRKRKREVEDEGDPDAKMANNLANTETASDSVNAKTASDSVNAKTMSNSANAKTMSNLADAEMASGSANSIIKVRTSNHHLFPIQMAKHSKPFIGKYNNGAAIKFYVTN